MVQPVGCLLVEVFDEITTPEDHILVDYMICGLNITALAVWVIFYTHLHHVSIEASMAGTQSIQSGPTVCM